jgi:hypothetical protein
LSVQVSRHQSGARMVWVNFEHSVHLLMYYDMILCENQ